MPNSELWRISPDLIGILNYSGQFENTNPAWQAVLGWDKDHVESRQFSDFVHPRDTARSLAAFETVKRGEPALNFRNRFRHRDGGYRWLSWHAVPEGDSIYCIARNVTEEMRDRTDLRRREREAELRDRFIAVLGHDLRNPLAALTSGVRMLERNPDRETVTEILSMANSSIGRMDELISDIMDFARSRFGTGMPLSMSDDEALRPALEHAVREIEVSHPDVAIHTQFAFADPVRCDVARVTQLVSNLLSNAVAHGDPDAPIELIACDTDGRFLLTVRNQGKPIPDKLRRNLFRPFMHEERAEHDSSGRRSNGLGLGLFICAEIARAHGGEMSVESSAAATEFTFTLEREAADRSALSDGTKAAADRARPTSPANPAPTANPAPAARPPGS